MLVPHAEVSIGSNLKASILTILNLNQLDVVSTISLRGHYVCPLSSQSQDGMASLQAHTWIGKYCTRSRPYRSRPASCQAFRTGDNRYSATLRVPSNTSAEVCMPADRDRRWPSSSRLIFFSTTKAL